ncbi:3'-5' exonuclease [Cohnella abietis]|uniref:Exonuclease domain-containing protein n=1 Tax=Cohnella abietis TaxID=2507935 RepID=A0A3T1DAS0_9BACL|nr:3'-5' exonuclease [Cohnella abietis]BBI35202.1 hypothetical protein KCTCHS21_46010 [Cohnella abietis]
MNRHTILLAAEFFQEGNEFYMTFYCEIPGVKKGYLYINLGHGQPKNAFWKGLLLTLQRIKNNQKRTLELAICSTYMTAFSEGNGQAEVIQALNQYSSYTIIDYKPFVDDLEKILLVGKSSESPPWTLVGYSMDQFAEMKNQSLTLMKQQAKQNRFYTEITMPKSGVVLDFETTSYITKFARVIEISALKFEAGEIIDEYHTLVNPEIKIPKASRDLTGISQEEVDAAPKSFDAMKKLYAFIKDSDIIVGHNIAYDYEFIEKFFNRFHFPVWKGKLLCTMRLAKSFKPGVKDYKLETLCDFYRISNERPHRAWSDTRATLEVMKHLYQDSLLLDVEVIATPRVE